MFVRSLLLSLAFVSTVQAQNRIFRSTHQGIFRPEEKGQFVCKELDFPVQKYVCNYIPVYESAERIQSRILKRFAGDRQFINPEKEYVSVLANGQLEFAHDNIKGIEAMLDAITNEFDVLDTYVPRRRVSLDLRVYEILQNANENFDFMIRQAYVAGNRGAPRDDQQGRFTLADIAGNLVPQIALGNLVTTLLTAALDNLEARSNIEKITKTSLIELTNGSSLSNRYKPVTQNLYITPSSVTTNTESTGISFEGEVRFLKNTNKIKISNFAVRVAQAPQTQKTDGSTPGVVTYSFGPTDLYFEMGCAQAIAATNQAEKSMVVEKRFFGLLGKKEKEEKIKKELLFVVQVIDTTARPPGEFPACENTNNINPEGN